MAKLGPLKVRGFTKETLRDIRQSHGPPVGVHPDSGERQWGYMGLSPDQREILGIEVFDLVDVVRADIDEAVPWKLHVVPGRDNLVAFTGTARKKLGLENFKGVDGNDTIGDIVELFRNEEGIIEIRRLEIGGNLDEYIEQSGSSWKTP